MSDARTRPAAGTAWDAVRDLAHDLVAAHGAWAPMMTSDASCVAFVSDRTGTPQLWVQDVPQAGAETPQAQLIALGPDPVLSVGWSPDDQWISCSVATGGGVRTEVWVVRPDGTDARRVAGGAGSGHAVLGPWAREGHGLVVTVVPDDPQLPHECVRIDPTTGSRDVIAAGGLIAMLDLSADGRFALLRDGTRGQQFCRLVDRRHDEDHPLLPFEQTGSTEVGLLRPPPPGETEADMVAYLVTDAGRSRRELVVVGIHDGGRRTAVGTLAARPDAELEFADADAAGERVLCVWNVQGRSEVEFVDTATGARHVVADLPGEVVTTSVLSRDASCAVLAVEGPTQPRRLWRLDCGTSAWTPVTASSLHPRAGLVEPELVHFDAHDGLPLSAWFYPARPGPGGGPPPAMISLHGGPEAQERPVFTPQHQVVVAAGISVLAPNIRGSSGFGRAFVHADDRWGRVDAIRDVADCARILAGRGLADPGRIAVTGRSYGGYATLMALIRHSPAFAAGVDICGMSDLHTFYRDTEPWIAAAATSKYGDPVHDSALLAHVSPLHAADAITVPLLVVHGELDTNVPLGEALQLVERLRALDRPVEYLQLEGEGHEYRRVEARLLLLETLTTFLTRVLAVSSR
ncbi:S9 family peptidase [uncultured Jatrophihabitans sp.]|uniref:S9 family peptidase n=1 Tax=uncultured Jatrophihabitans sp. TaxID=1610747 RepID=UPI0035CBA7A3